MALSGALADIEVVELIQFPSSGRRSGELVIEQGRQQARLYYAKGRLVHAALGHLKGAKVLAKVVGWRSGQFVFHGEVPSPETSIEMEVHHAVLEAVRARDEEVEQEARRRAAGEPADEVADEALLRVLRAFLATNAWAQEVTVLTANGVVAARARQDEADDHSTELAGALAAHWPRHGLRRFIAEDEGGTVVALPLGVGGAAGALVVAAPRTVAAGMVSVAAGKLAASLGA
jgi:hypothetical protein